MATVTRVIMISLLLASMMPQALAQRRSGGIECATTMATYRVHFTAYQQPKGIQGGTYLERYCEQIPLPGEVLITLDIYRTYGAEIIRDQPVAVRVLEGAPDAEASRVLLEFPAKIYSSGIVEMRPNFTNPGDYHVVVAIGENPTEENTAVIPLRVGMSSGLLNIDSTTISLLLLMLIILVGLGTYSFYSGRKAQSKEKQGE
jgi:hypothetical protein